MLLKVTSQQEVTGLCPWGSQEVGEFPFHLCSSLLLFLQFVFTYRMPSWPLVFSMSVQLLGLSLYSFVCLFSISAIVCISQSPVSERLGSLPTILL